MLDCCPTDLDDGAPAGGAGFAALFEGTFTTDGAVANPVDVADLTPVGSHILVRNLVVQLIFLTQGGVLLGDVGQITQSNVQAQRGTTDGIVIFGAPPYGPPGGGTTGAGAVNTSSSGYQQPLLYAPVAGVAVTWAIVGNVVRFVGTGLAGVLIEWSYVGELYVRRGATRLIA